MTEIVGGAAVIAVLGVGLGSIASVRQCPPLVRSPTNSNHSWRIQTSLWCNLPVHSKSSNCGTVFGVLNPRDIPTRCLPLDDFVEPVVPRFQNRLFPLRQIGAHIMPDEDSRLSASCFVPDHRGDEI
jgi:hypothetical protein